MPVHGIMIPNPLKHLIKIIINIVLQRIQSVMIRYRLAVAEARVTKDVVEEVVV